MKTGKEIKTNSFKDYSVTFGSVNNKNPKAIYINISAWAEPKEDMNVNYNVGIRAINKRVKQLLYIDFSSDVKCLFDKDRTIVDLDIRESGIRYGKRSFMSCEVTLYLYEEHSITTDYMKDKLEEITRNVIENVFDNNKIFKFHKKKK